MRSSQSYYIVTVTAKRVTTPFDVIRINSPPQTLHLDTQTLNVMLCRHRRTAGLTLRWIDPTDLSTPF